MNNEDSMESNSTNILDCSSNNEILDNPNTAETLGFSASNEIIDDLNSDPTETKTITIVSEATNTITIVSGENSMEEEGEQKKSDSYSENIWTVEDNINPPKKKLGYSIKSICCFIILLIVLFGGLYVYLNYKSDLGESRTNLMQFEESEKVKEMEKKRKEEEHKQPQKQKEEEKKQLQKQKEEEEKLRPQNKLKEEDKQLENQKEEKEKLRLEKQIKEAERQEILKKKLGEQAEWLKLVSIHDLVTVTKPFSNSHISFDAGDILMVTELVEIHTGNMMLNVETKKNQRTCVPFHQLHNLSPYSMDEPKMEDIW